MWEISSPHPRHHGEEISKRPTAGTAGVMLKASVRREMSAFMVRSSTPIRVVWHSYRPFQGPGVCAGHLLGRPIERREPCHPGKTNWYTAFMPVDRLHRKITYSRDIRYNWCKRWVEVRVGVLLFTIKSLALTQWWPLLVLLLLKTPLQKQVIVYKNIKNMLV